MTIARVVLRALSITLLGVVSEGASALTSGQAYVKAVGFLRSQGATAWESLESQPVLLGEAIAADARAAGPRSATLLASLELASVDARARRMRTLGELQLNVLPEAQVLVAAKTPLLGFGVSRDHLPTPLDTALAIQALDAAGWSVQSTFTEATNDLVAQQIASGAHVGMWPLVRKGATGDFATTAQAVLALAPRESSYPGALGLALTWLWGGSPPLASERALQVLALLAVDSSLAPGALGALVGLQNANGSFGSEPALADRVYATALAARALLESAAAFPFDSDGDGTADGPDPDADGDGVCDPGESGAGCTGSDAFPTDPGAAFDIDLDGFGNAADPDDDGDGIPDAQEPGYAANAQERVNTDGDALADTADPDDDNDSLADVQELLAGLDPRRVDTDGDTFRDNLELAAGTDGRNASQYPLPDGDVFPLGAPDGLVDDRDVLLALRVVRGLVSVPGSAQTAFLRHADVAPLVAGAPAPSGAFDGADAVVLVRRVRDLVAAW